MKLDLLYEVQAPKPWPDKPYPYNQREAEQAAYFEAIEQIKLADKLGFGTVWVVEHHFRIERSHMPVNDVFLAALSQITDQIRLGFGVTLTPHKFRHPVRTAGDGRRRRPAEPRTGRVGHRTLDPPRAEGVRHRSRHQPRLVARGHRVHRRDVGAGEVQLGLASS